MDGWLGWDYVYQELGEGKQNQKKRDNKREKINA
jgi:hypothetical protein